MALLSSLFFFSLFSRILNGYQTIINNSSSESSPFLSPYLLSLHPCTYFRFAGELLSAYCTALSQANSQLSSPQIRWPELGHYDNILFHSCSQAQTAFSITFIVLLAHVQCHPLI